MRVSGDLAWVKPAVAAGGNERTAAHEKIVADLSYKLGFAVAPAVLSEHTKGHGLPDIVALSFATLKQPAPWSAIVGHLTESHKRVIGKQLSAILALHCWIDDHDHDWNDANALFELDASGAARAVFYDYGHSLTHAWTPPAPAPVRDWARREGPWAFTKPSEIIDAVEQIRKLAVNDLEHIIKRIPTNCLSPELGVHLVAALDHRRTQLRTLLNLAGAP